MKHTSIGFFPSPKCPDIINFPGPTAFCSVALLLLYYWYLIIRYVFILYIQFFHSFLLFCCLIYFFLIAEDLLLGLHFIDFAEQFILLIMDLAIQAVQALKNHETDPNLVRFHGFSVLQRFPTPPPRPYLDRFSFPTWQGFIPPVVLRTGGPTFNQEINLTTTLLGDWPSGSHAELPETPVYMNDCPLYLSSILMSIANSPLSPHLAAPVHIFNQVLESEYVSCSFQANCSRSPL